MNPTLRDKRALVTGGSRASTRPSSNGSLARARTWRSRTSASPTRPRKIAAAARSSACAPWPFKPTAPIRRPSPRRSSGRRDELGGIDILVNNAGIATMAPIDAVHARGFRPDLLRSTSAPCSSRPRPRSGTCATVDASSASAAAMPSACRSRAARRYAMSKSALQGLVKGLARDLGPRGITINNVQPGPVDTDMNPATGDFAESAEEADGATALRHARRDRRDGRLPRRPRSRVHHRRQLDDRRRLHGLTRRGFENPPSVA